MIGRKRITAALAATLLLFAAPGIAAGPSAQEPVAEPLPLEVAASLHGHNGRSPINLSPDGEWLAHTVETDESVPRGVSSSYSDTGVPFAEGSARMRATLSNTRTDEVIRLGGADSSSWAGVWSPDGERVAFYSDEGGEAGLWIWERESREATRIPEMIVRPFFGFETPRWAPDGRRLLVKALPADTTLTEANARLAAPGEDPPMREVVPGEVSVTVRRSTAAERSTAGAGGDDPSPPSDPISERIDAFATDLALVDVVTGDLERIVRGETVVLYAFSPDGRRVAYTVQAGFLRDTFQSLYELRLHDLESGDDTLLADDVQLRYGIEWSWSPDGRWLAYFESGQTAEGDLVLVSIPDGEVHRLENDPFPSFAPGEGEIPPIWSPDATSIFAVGDGALWRIATGSLGGREVASIDGWRIRNLVTPSYATPVAWTPGRGTDLWLLAAEEGAGRGGIWSVDAADGSFRSALREAKSYSGVFSIAASEATGEIAFVSRDQQVPGEARALDTVTGEVREVSRINPALGRHALGRARVIEWRGTDGDALAGTLLLPPDHRAGEPLPLVVWVYGGSLGSRSVNRFGLWGGMPLFNMHVLATRGYAVLFPDAPVRTGRITEDLLATVLPGVNAAIEQGWADPERLAMMGQSYGSINVLALLTRTTRFKAAVITAAVLHPDLFADYLGDLDGSGTGYYEQGQGNMGGTIWEVPDRYRDNSPIFDFPRIETPILIGQGEQDGNLVPTGAIFNALERLDRWVELRLYAGEGHVLSRKANVIDFWRRRLEFLGEHLGGE